MNLIKALLLLAAACGGYQYWQGRAAKVDLAAATSASDFVQVPMPDGMDTHGVVVFAPDNCPSDAAQRAYALVGKLGDKGVPVVRSSSASFDDLPDAATAARVRAVMKGISRWCSSTARRRPIPACTTSSPNTGARRQADHAGAGVAPNRILRSSSDSGVVRAYGLATPA
jgi:hypothetical protein